MEKVLGYKNCNDAKWYRYLKIDPEMIIMRGCQTAQGV